MTDYGLGAIPSPADPRDFELPLDTAIVLPRRYVASGMGPVLNQGNTGRCVAFASTGMKHWQEKRDGHGVLPFDPQWLYEQACAVDGINRPYSIQRGTTLRAALSVLLKKGEPLLGKPLTAGHYKIAAYYAVPMTTDAMKRAIFQYGPILVAHRWNTAWFNPVNGILPNPTGDWDGGHARLTFGWDDTINGGCWIRRNSWRSTWGRNGNSYDRYGFDNAIHDAWKAIDVLT